MHPEPEPTLEYALACQWQFQLERLGFRVSDRRLIVKPNDVRLIWEYRYNPWRLTARWARYPEVSFELFDDREEGTVQAAVFVPAPVAFRVAVELIEMLLNPPHLIAHRVTSIAAKIENRYRQRGHRANS